MVNAFGLHKIYAADAEDNNAPSRRVTPTRNWQRAILAYLDLYLAAFIAQHLTERLRNQLFEHLQRLSLDWHSKQKKGDLVQRVWNNSPISHQALIDLLVTEVADLFPTTLRQRCLIHKQRNIMSAIPMCSPPCRRKWSVVWMPCEGTHNILVVVKL